MSSSDMTRRRFIQFGLVGLAGLPALLQACGGSGAHASISGSSSAPAAAGGSLAAAPASSGSAAAPQGNMVGGVKLPTYVPVEGAKPDLPGSADGLVNPGYLTMPKDAFASVKSAPGKGTDVTIMTWSFTGALPPPVEQNQQWQAINKDIGANLKFNIVAYADYGTRFSTVISGNDLPDILFISPTTAVDQLPAFLKAKCADLTPYLSGDAAKDYPNLANFPTLSWRNVVFNNGHLRRTEPVPRLFHGAMDAPGVAGPGWPGAAEDGR